MREQKSIDQGVLWCDNGSRNGSNVRFWLVHTLTAGTRSLAADLRSSISFCMSLDLFSYSSMFFFCWSMVCMRPLTSWLLRPPGPDPGVTAPPPPPPELTALSRSIYRTGGAKVFFRRFLEMRTKISFRFFMVAGILRGEITFEIEPFTNYVRANKAFSRL